MIWNIWLIWITFCSIFDCNIIKINNFIFTFRYCSSSVLHTFPTFAPCGYDVILSKVCSFLSSLLYAILLFFSVNTVCGLRFVLFLIVTSSKLIILYLHLDTVAVLFCILFQHLHHVNMM